MKLRKAQQRAKDDIIQSIRNGHKKICLYAHCRWGKTVVFSDIANGARAKGNRVWILVHTQELLEQTRETLFKFGIHSGAIQGTHPDQNYSLDVQVVMNQTITRRWTYFDINPEHLPDICIVDECDLQFKARNELAGMKPDILFIGVTGSPTAKGMGLFYTDLITGSTVQESLDNNLLVPIRAYSCYTPDLKGIKLNSNGDFSEPEMEKRVNTKALRGDIVRNWLRLGDDRKTIVYATNVAHARDMHREFESNGIESALVTGHTEDNERKEFIAGFKDSTVKVLVSVMCLTRGFDIVDIGCVIMARSTKSMALYIQMVSRGMTLNDAYDDCIVLDYSDNVARLGFPQDFNVTELSLGEKGEAKDRKPKDDPLPKPCPKCSIMKPIGAMLCPACGFEAEVQSRVETEAGELVELKSASAKRNRDMSWDEKALFMSELNRIALDKSYKSGWTFQKYRAYFDVLPFDRRLKNIAPAEVIRESTQRWITSQNIRYANRRTA